MHMGYGYGYVYGYGYAYAGHCRVGERGAGAARERSAGQNRPESWTA